LKSLHSLGGYIILFSILSGLLMDLHPFGSASPLLCGALEITTGIAQLAASSLPYAGKVSAVLTSDKLLQYRCSEQK